MQLNPYPSIPPTEPLPQITSRPKSAIQLHRYGYRWDYPQKPRRDPNRLYASQTSGWFGQIIQRSHDGGKTWEPVGNQFAYEGTTGTHQWYDVTQHPWEFKRVWHLEPSLHDPDTVYAGVEDAALFRTTDGGKSWHELPGLRNHGKGHLWQPGAGGMGLHTLVLDPVNPGRMYGAISAAGVFRCDDARSSGSSPANRTGHTNLWTPHCPRR